METEKKPRDVRTGVDGDSPGRSAMGRPLNVKYIREAEKKLGLPHTLKKTATTMDGTPTDVAMKAGEPPKSPLAQNLSQRLASKVAKVNKRGADNRAAYERALQHQQKSDTTMTKTSPPGWSGTVEHMKQHKDIKNPFALAWSMKKKGYKPHHADVKKGGIDGCALCFKAACDSGMLKGGLVLVAGMYYQRAPGPIAYLPDSLFKAHKDPKAPGVRGGKYHRTKGGKIH